MSDAIERLRREITTSYEDGFDGGTVGFGPSDPRSQAVEFLLRELGEREK